MTEDLALQQYRVLHLGKFYPPHSGGMETHLQDLVVRLARVAEVSVVVANSERQGERCVVDGARLTRVARWGTIASMPICPGLTRAIRHSPADIVHIHTPNPGAALAFLASGHQGRVVITHHADTLGRKVLRRISDPIVTRLMQRASRILVTSSRYLESSPELAPYRQKCAIVPLGIDPGVAVADPRAIEALRRELPGRFILAVGRLVPYKGFDVLIRAMKSVNARLVLIGAGPLGDELRQLVRSEGVEDRVVMPGRVDEIASYFAAASLFVLPSTTRAEAFGIVQLEAMATGVPVVNTELDSGVPEVSVHGQTGFTVPPGDPQALASAIQTLLDRQDLRDQFGRAAKERVHSEFTADLMCSRTMRVYEEVLGSL